MSNMRQRNTLLIENIELKRQKQKDNNKFNRLLSEICGKMDQMVNALNELKNKEFIVNVVGSNESGQIKIDQKVKKKEDKRMFIPTPETEGMKISVSDIKKKIKKTKIKDSVIKLTKLQNKL